MELIEIDKILTEARGLCWHEIKSNSKWGGGAFCIKCKTSVLVCQDNSSPTTNWTDYGEVIEWADKQEWFKEFINDFLSYGKYDDMFTMLNPETGSRAIADFIESEGK